MICDAWDEEEQAWLCRGYMDAPEIDACVLVRAQGLKPGALARVALTGADAYDLQGELLAIEEGISNEYAE